MNNPQNGMRVKIVRLEDTKGMLIKQHHLDIREVGQTGILSGYVPGHGGDVWWVNHDNGTIGAYSINEFEEIQSPKEMTNYGTLTTTQLIDALTDDANIFTSRREVADALRARIRELENKYEACMGTLKQLKRG